MMKAYHPHWILFNTHLETIYPALLRRVDFNPSRELVIDTDDGDFLEADWYSSQNQSLVILSHGLEGHARRPYMRGMARALFNEGFDVLAWNFRSCSGKINKSIRFYHSGATYDLDSIVQYSIRELRYERIFLLGFSIGGNLTIKYLGENRKLEKEIISAMAVSVPMNLAECCNCLEEGRNWLYQKKFLMDLKEKVRLKEKVFSLNTEGLEEIKTLREFDNRYTAPLHGFKDADDYYGKCSSGNFLNSVEKPLLILNSKNDSFLSPACFPEKYDPNPLVEWVITERGGHVGFGNPGETTYYSEKLASDYFGRF